MITNAYSGRVTNWPLVWLMNGLFVVLVVVGGLSHADVGLGVVAAVVLITNLMMTSLRTTVGPAGVTVRYGVLSVPRFHYPLESIERAEAVDVPSCRIGGLGVHWSPWRGTRLTIRSGPALVLHRPGRASVTISAADPESAAAIINSQHSIV